ncbi:tRNA uridine-5-carboxymethylaminomethyl(34) synthesis GTPase MnmE [Halodesulfovibrio sp.]|jgi:tRNA modification GTPase|uniref:tRNA uridine-5-carboxymethylaminomethyl(34) synthesis GTPase MnmE n=1 Tax=Halodesulfovibrio sp. TaxID=1912772 RepID=UPI0025D6BBEE|nr:tRNA uridine-5-carboxymethylaminomethyl(34) synthesis GTPase MnmE [Halodesulfovibrio sp.]MCT4627106.1 tRNA uridine-5-carboxymethylaminomethyl(34) synthesis GTPase MnmE [Halodesulfovibrio sp.]
MTQNDTIAAIATAMGQGGIGIIRISGSEAGTILRKLFRSSSEKFSGFRPWVLHHGHIKDAKGEDLDDVLVVHMPGTKTFTGEECAEIHCHGGPAILSSVLEAIFALGARPADCGEFSKRAFLNGRMDLTQVEAIAEMIAAPAREGVRLAQAKLDGLLGKRIAELRTRLEFVRMKLCVAVDFPEEDLECLDPQEFTDDITNVMEAIRTLVGNFDRARCWRDGALVVLAGQVNAGKSSLMNGLLGRKRAIVTDIPGTTRDFLEEHLTFDGLPIRLVDTAGLRETGDIVEQEGVRLSRDLASQADLVLLVVDGTRGLGTHEKELIATVGAEKVLLVWNKVDLVEGEQQIDTADCAVVQISAKHGDGLDMLAESIRTNILTRNGDTKEPEAGDLVPNLRQSHALSLAASELEGLLDDLAMQIPYDLLGVRLETACSILSEITGETTPDEILNKIFESFCIGK